MAKPVGKMINVSDSDTNGVTIPWSQAAMYGAVATGLNYGAAHFLRLSILDNPGIASLYQYLAPTLSVYTTLKLMKAMTGPMGAVTPGLWLPGMLLTTLVSIVNPASRPLIPFGLCLLAKYASEHQDGEIGKLFIAGDMIDLALKEEYDPSQ